MPITFEEQFPNHFHLLLKLYLSCRLGAVLHAEVTVSAHSNDSTVFVAEPAKSGRRLLLVREG